MLIKTIGRYLAENKLKHTAVSANAEAIQQEFYQDLEKAGLPNNIYSKKEVLDLIRAFEWFLSNFAFDGYNKIKMDVAKVPILAPFSEKILVNGKFQPRTRIVLAVMEGAGHSIDLEVYAGYVIEDWALPGKPYQITTDLDIIERLVQSTMPGGRR